MPCRWQAFVMGRPLAVYSGGTRILDWQMRCGYVSPPTSANQCANQSLAQMAGHATARSSTGQSCAAHRTYTSALGPAVKRKLANIPGTERRDRIVCVAREEPVVEKPLSASAAWRSAQRLQRFGRCIFLAGSLGADAGSPSAELEAPVIRADSLVGRTL
jgi:hypothetical protein